jgi:hypothetical protein
MGGYLVFFDFSFIHPVLTSSLFFNRYPNTNKGFIMKKIFVLICLPLATGPAFASDFAVRGRHSAYFIAEAQRLSLARSLNLKWTRAKDSKMIDITDEEKLCIWKAREAYDQDQLKPALKGILKKSTYLDS